MYKYSFLWLVFLFTLGIIPITNGQQLIRHLSSEDGLSQGMIYDMLQDEDGFIWMGTKDGLNRFDGSNFKVYINDPEDTTSISGNTVTLLFEDSKGYIWAASENSGLNIYNKKSGDFHHIKYAPTGLSGNKINHILEDKNGNIIVDVAGLDLNVFKLDDSFYQDGIQPKIRRITMPVQQYLVPNERRNIFRIYKDRNEDVFVLGDEFYYRLDITNASLIKMGPANESYSKTYFEENGTGYAFDRNGTLDYIDGRDTTFLKKYYIEPLSFLSDGQSHYSIHPDFIRFLDYNPVSGKISNEGAISLPNGVPNSMLKDKSGLLWVGSNGYGVYVYNLEAKKFNHQYKGKSVCGLEYLNEALIVNTYDSAWTDIDRLQFRISPDHPEYEPYKILPLSENEVFYKYFIRGINKYFYEKRKNDEAVFSLNLQFSSSGYDPIIKLADGSVLAAGDDDYLVIFNSDDGNYTILDLKDELIVNNMEEIVQRSSKSIFTSLYEDVNGILWVGTNQGFLAVERNDGSKKLSIKRFHNISNDTTSLSYNHVSSFLPDPVSPHKYLWISTKGGGLNRLDIESGIFDHYTKSEGLPDDVVYGILSDNNGNLWGSSNKGIFCMLPKSGHQDYEIKKYNKSDGLQDDEFNTDAFLKLPDGRLAFGGVNGINIFDPAQVLRSNFTPPIYITDIAVNNASLSSKTGDEILNFTPEYASNLTLDPGQDIVSIQYASLDFRNPEAINYQYKMEGLGDNWIQAGNQQSATFVNLPAADYTFRVRGTNSQNQWNNNEAEINITVLPPWYRSWLAYLLYLSAVFGIITWLLATHRRRTALKHQLELERKEAERIRELEQSKTKLFTNLTHEFRTPLTVIIGMARELKDDSSKNIGSKLDMITRNGENLLSMVNKMLELSKLENKKSHLKLEQGEIISFLQQEVNAIMPLTRSKGIQLHFLPQIERFEMLFDSEKMNNVVNNLLSNAFKFTQKGGHIYLIASRQKGALLLQFIDTGIGIPTDKKDKIFDRFFQIDDSATRSYEGTGLGLSLCKELITQMGGKIYVNSPPRGKNVGSEFVVELPIYQQDEEIRHIHDEIEERITTTIVDVSPSSDTENEMKAIVSSTEPFVLIVEDNQDVAAYIQSCLSEYKTIIASNGQDGLHKAKNLIPDLIVSDVMMPIMDGYEFCKQVKSDPLTSHIPVIMLTAKVSQDSKLQGLEHGANAYINKPFEKTELLLTIANLFDLRRKTQLHMQNVFSDEKVNFFTEKVMPNISSRDSEFLAQLNSNVEDNLANANFTVQELAKKMFLSQSQLGRKLNALTGKSPNNYLVMKRLQNAKRLLEDTDLPINDIAYQSGFNDPSYFARVFKKNYGISPSGMR